MRQVLRNINGEGRGLGVLALGCAALALAGCGSGGGGGGGSGSYAPGSTTAPSTSGSVPGTAANLTALDLYPKGDIAIFGSASATAAAPPQQQIIVVGFYKDGAQRDLTRGVTYKVADPKVATVSGDGLVTPVGAGTTTLTVTQSGAGGQTLSITRNIVVNMTKIAAQPGVQATSLELYPGPVTRLTDVNPTKGVNQFQQFVVVVRYADGTCIDITRNFGLQITDTQGNPTVAAAFSSGGLLNAKDNATIEVIANATAINMVASVEVISGSGTPGANAAGFTPFTGGALAGSTNAFDVVALAALKSQNISPAALSSDGEFLRRVTSDLIGRLPTQAELKAFVANTDPAKRAKTIDALLAMPAFATHWGQDIVGAWFQVSGNNQKAFDAELVTEIGNDVPLSMIVNAVAAGTGPLGTGFDAQFPMAYMKSDILMNVFTGYTSKCARCHDHPLTTAMDNPNWIQDQNYGLYAFFAATKGDATKVNKAAQMFGTPLDPAWVFDPTQNATLPKLTDAAGNMTPIAARRQKFADLLVASTQFARGTGHRIWAEVMDQLLDPNQFLQVNLAGVANPKLLDTATAEFTTQKTSLKGFLREITNSKVYQLSTAGSTTKNDALLARRTVRRHHSEVLNSGVAAIAGVPYTMDSFFSFNFGYPSTRLSITERNDAINMGQAFTLMNSTHATNGLIVMNGNQIATLATSVDNKTIQLQDAITTLFETALSRDPSPTEMSTFVTERANATTTQMFLEDSAVALGASIEYVMR